jgi:hypothetical protein
VNSDVVLRNRLNRELSAPLHLKAIDSDILDIVVVPVVGVAADDTSFVEEETAIAAVNAEQRHKVEKIDVVVDDHLLPRCDIHALHIARILLVAARKLEELFADRGVLVHTE